MYKIASIVFIIFLTTTVVGVILLIGDFELSEKEEELNLELEVEFVELEGKEAQALRVLSNEKEEVFYITIDEFVEWIDEEMKAFEKIPEVGGRKVSSNNFNFFDRAAKISPDNKKLVFSVHDYAALTTTTFIVIVDLREGEMNLIDETVYGTVGEYVWSSDSYFVAYTLGTARASGDFLSVDNSQEKKKEFVLSEEDLLRALDDGVQFFEGDGFMPVFRNLEWSEEFLYFTTNHPEKGELIWKVNSTGEELELVKPERE
jgi:hypothetical protein